MRRILKLVQIVIQSRIIDSHSLPQGNGSATTGQLKVAQRPATATSTNGSTKKKLKVPLQPTVCRRIFGNSGSQGQLYDSNTTNTHRHVAMDRPVGLFTPPVNCD
jgi:hypothetical protein